MRVNTCAKYNKARGWNKLTPKHAPMLFFGGRVALSAQTGCARYKIQHSKTLKAFKLTGRARARFVAPTRRQHAARFVFHQLPQPFQALRFALPQRRIAAICETCSE